MSAPRPDFATVPGADARRDPVRLLVVQGDERPAVDVAGEPVAMTFPHPLVREFIAFLALSLFLVVLALLFDAPLEALANPERTPNPAKAPWYFLGLQELLHYYPPLVSGVLLPAAVAVALAIVPHFRVNLERAPLWASGRRRKLAALGLAVAALTAVFLWTGAHAVWPIIGPLWAVGAAMAAGALPGRAAGWLARRSLAFWVFLWFLLGAVTLTVVGVFFRGPGWAFVLPWRDGLYY
jgi:hypothetical protein